MGFPVQNLPTGKTYVIVRKRGTCKITKYWVWVDLKRQSKVRIIYFEEPGFQNAQTKNFKNSKLK